VRDLIRRAPRRLPPVLLGGLLVMWLLMNQTFSAAQIVLGSVLAGALVWASATLRPLQPKLHRVHLAASLISIVLVDIVRSNVAVARIILGLTGGRRVVSGFVDIPLELRDPHGLAALAVIVTSTPGTVWVDLAEDGSRLTLHVLDLKDEAECVRWIKQRYEAPLMRIFE
jgi:multicomponent K+:H+ antiporter subunit E